MRKTLLATTALAFAGAMAAGPASAADKLSLGLGGYMNQWFGFTSIDGGNYGTLAEPDLREGVVDIRSNSEVHFKGSLKADNGLTFGVKVEFEGNNTGDSGAVIDESMAWVSGEFGKLTIGAEDSVQSLMHTSVGNAGLDLGEVRMFFPENEAYYTANWQADHKRIVYMTPRMSGVQFGMSYGPGPNENYGHQSDGDLANNDSDTWSMAVNVSQEFAGGTVNMSVGHINKGADSEASNVGIKISMGGLTAGVAHLDEDDASPREMTVAGLTYADGPMSVSVNVGQTSHATGDVSIGMLSAGYTLAPGVSAHSSLFNSESEVTQVINDDGTMSDFQGTGFVMGIKIGF